MRRMDFDEFDDFGGLGQIITGEQLKGLLLSGFSGGGGILLVGAGVRALPPSVGPIWRSVIAAFAGLIGGRILYEIDEDAARGFSGGVTGFGLASLINSLAPSVPVGLSQYGDKPGRYYGWGMGRWRGPRTAQQVMQGLGRTRVVEQPWGSPELGYTRVADKPWGAPALAGQGEPGGPMPYYGWGMGGVGQDVTVGSWLT